MCACACPHVYAYPCRVCLSICVYVYQCCVLVLCTYMCVCVFVCVCILLRIYHAEKLPRTNLVFIIADARHTCVQCEGSPLVQDEQPCILHEAAPCSVASSTGPEPLVVPSYNQTQATYILFGAKLRDKHWLGTSCCAELQDQHVLPMFCRGLSYERNRCYICLVVLSYKTHMCSVCLVC